MSWFKRRSPNAPLSNSRRERLVRRRGTRWLAVEQFEERRLLAAAIFTDKPDYKPGETAQISGSGFQVGETVRLQVTRTDGVPDLPDGNLPWLVTDGGAGDLDLLLNGSIATSWFVEEQYSDASLLLTAEGLASGLVATTEFTDSVSSVTIDNSANPSITTASGTSVSVPFKFSYVTGGTGANATTAVNWTVYLRIGGSEYAIATGSQSGITPGATNTVGPQSVTVAFDGGSGGGVVHLPRNLGNTNDRYDLRVQVDKLNGNNPGSRNDTSANTWVTVTPEIAPEVVGVSSVPSPKSYGVGEVVPVKIQFSAAVDVTGTPTLNLDSGPPAAIAYYVSGSGTSSLLFEYTVSAGQNSADLNYNSTGSLNSNGGTISGSNGMNAKLNLPPTGSTNSLAGTSDIVIDTAGPTITNVTSTTSNGAFGVGSVINVTVNWSETVFIAGGSPQIALNSGGTALYIAGSGSTTTTFSYTVAAGQNSADLNYAATNSLTTVGTIRDALGNNATTTLPNVNSGNSLGGSKAIVIDTAGPSVVSYSVIYGVNNLEYNLASLPTGRTVLPWQVKGVKVLFNEPIGQGSASSLTGLSATGFSGLNTNTLIWTFSTLADLNYSTKLLGTTTNAITDPLGNSLQGGIGNGTDFSRAFAILYGDVNGDRIVNSSDMAAVSINITSPGAMAVFADVNGSGGIDISDYQIVRSRVGRKL